MNHDTLLAIESPIMTSTTLSTLASLWIGQVTEFNVGPCIDLFWPSLHCAEPKRPAVVLHRRPGA